MVGQTWEECLKLWVTNKKNQMLNRRHSTKFLMNMIGDTLNRIIHAISTDQSPTVTNLPAAHEGRY